MHILVAILLSFFSQQLFAVGLQTFDAYKRNNALLESDISRLATFANNEKDKIFSDTLYQYKYLLSKYETLNSRLSLVTFSEDAANSGWPNIKRIARNLASLCENGRLDEVACLEGLERLKTFVITSNLSGSDKESIITFLQDYSSEVKIVATFNEDFVSSFNKNSELINNKKMLNKTSSSIIVNVTPVETRQLNTEAVLVNEPTAQKILTKNLIEPKVEPVWQDTLQIITDSFSPVFLKIEYLINQITLSNIFFALGAILFFVLSLLAYSLMGSRKMVKQFQEEIFKIAQLNKVKIKVFGRLEFDGVTKMDRVKKYYLDSFLHSKIVSTSAQVKFKTKNNNLLIETVYLTDRSVQNFLDKESAAFQCSLEVLKQTVESANGDFLFNNKFNEKGEITQTGYVISLPKY